MIYFITVFIKASLILVRIRNAARRQRQTVIL